MTKKRNSLLLAIPLCGIAVLGAFWLLQSRHNLGRVASGVDREGIASHGQTPRSIELERGHSDDAILKQTTSESTEALDPVALFGDLRRRHRMAAVRYARKPFDEVCYTGFPSLERLHLTEIRLLSLSFPEKSFTLARALLHDPSSDKVDKDLACYSLGILLQAGLPEASETLVQATKTRDSAVSQKAIETIADFGSLTRHRDILIPAAFEGHIPAIQALGRDGSIENISRLETLVSTLEKSPLPGLWYAVMEAQEALEKARILGQQEWNALLLDIIVTQGGHKVPWVLKVIETQPIEGIDLAFRDFLQKAEHREIEFLRNAPGFDQRHNPTEDLICSIDLSDHQSYYDDVLLAYSKLGAKLSSLQKARLEYFGMLGDPKELLRIQLSKKSVWDTK